MILDESTVVIPDLVFVSKHRSSIVTERALEGAPDLIVEILSPSTERRDRGAKIKLFARFGVDWYWTLSAEARRLEVYQRRGDAYELAADRNGDEVYECVVPNGVRLELSNVWPD